MHNLGTFTEVITAMCKTCDKCNFDCVEYNYGSMIIFSFGKYAIITVMNIFKVGPELLRFWS